MRQLAISDIHGCAQTFRKLVDEVVQIQPDDELYLLGDYVNRGPDPWGVFDFIFELQERGLRVVCLRGNHEDRLIETYDRGETPVSLRYIKFIRSLKSYHEVGPFLLVHAGLNFSVPHPMHDQVAMRWIRDWEHTLDLDWLGDRHIVHGHIRTPRTHIEQGVQARSPIIRIDSGCFSLHESGQGHLCAFDMSNWNVYFQENVDMMAAVPWWQRW